MRDYAIGWMSRETGVNIETIRYYERIRLMPKPLRTPGGNRQYDHDQLKRLSFIKRSRELGFGIAEIRMLLELVDRSDVTCKEVHAMTTVHLESVSRKITDLRNLESSLKNMVAACGRGLVPDCPIIDTLFDLA